ncbi:MAG: DMT family transporter [Holosporales bacterium]|jgi:drug/metabolite transporter (DMT)-like permease
MLRRHLTRVAVQSQQSAFFWMLICTVLMSMIPIIAHFLAARVHPLQMVFVRSALQFVFILPFIAFYFPAVVSTRRLSAHAWRGINGAISMSLWFYGIAHLPLANVVTLSSIAPIFTTILAAWWLGEQVHLRRWIAIAVGFGGVLLVAQPEATGFTWVAGIVVLQAFMVAVANFFVKSLTTTERNLTILFYMGVFVVPLTLPGALLFWMWPTPAEWGWLTLMAFCGVLAHFALNRAFRMAEASALMPLDYLRLPIAVGADVLLFAQMPTEQTLLGAAAILVACLYILHRERLHRRRTTDVEVLPR